jgi:hypothetical protein
MLDKQDVKLGLKREKVEVTKMEAQDGMVKAMHEASHIELAKMTQEEKILMADMSGINLLVRAWYEIYREWIEKEVMAAQAAKTSASMVATPRDGDEGGRGGPPLCS